MAKSIKWRLVTIFVILVIIVMMACGTLIVSLISKNAYQDMENSLKNELNIIKKSINVNSTEKLEEDLRQIINDTNNANMQIYLINNNAEIVYPNNDLSKDRFNSSPMIMAAINQISIKELDKVYIEDIEYRGYAEPIVINQKVPYVLYTIISTEQLKDNLVSTIYVIVSAILLAIALSVILGFMLSDFITKPIIALTNKAREMAKGDLNNPIGVLSDDEIGQLTVNFNMMASELNNTLIEISSEKNKLETVFTHMTDGILVFDIEGKLIHINPAASELLGESDKNALKGVFESYLKINFDSLLKQTKKDLMQHIIEINDKYVNLCFAPYLDKDKNIIGNICVIQDITEHKKLEEMQKEFVANVSHELRTPLTTIKSYAETLLDGALEDKEIAISFLEVINNEGDRMTALVQDLLELSRLDNKQTKFKMNKINLTYILEESINKLQIHAKKKEQAMNYHKPDDEHFIIGDANRVEQVIKNIISNAIKYSLEKSLININVYEEQGNIVIAIRDNGMGIPTEDLPRIFERFYRVDKARSRAMGGTGLGLAIAKEIMDYHNGSIRVESEVSVGTCFYLCFPKINMLPNS